MNRIREPFEVNYALLSLLQFVFSILVMLLHSRRILSSDILHFIQKSMFSRLSVPFFMISSAFFVESYCNNTTYFKTYIAKLVKTYWYLSLLYIPYALYYFVQEDYPVRFLPLGIIFSFFYFGTCYHLWYFPAIIFAWSFLFSLRKFFSEKTVIIICLLLYFIGTVETYSAYLSGTVLFDVWQNYQKVFVTSRNGLFYAPIFILLGQKSYIFRKSFFLNSHLLSKLILSVGLFIVEAFFIFINQGYDKNFFISLLPVTFFLFNWCIRSHLFSNKQWHYLKKLSIYYFYVHPIILEIIFFYADKTDLLLWQKGIFTFLCTFLLTHLLAMFLLKNKHRISS